MAYKRTRESIFLSVRGLHARGGKIERLANAGVADLTTIHDVVSVDADLVAQDRVVVVVHLGLESFDSAWTKTDQMVPQVIVFLLRQLGWGFQQFGFFSESGRLLVTELIVECFQSSVIEFLFVN